MYTNEPPTSATNERGYGLCERMFDATVAPMPLSHDDDVFSERRTTHLCPYTTCTVLVVVDA